MQEGVGEFRIAIVEEVVCEGDVFVEDDGVGEFLVGDELAAGGAHQGAHGGVEAGEFPAVGETREDGVVDAGLIVHHGIDDGLEEVGIGVFDGRAVRAEAEAVFHELADGGAGRLAGLVHFVERLHGGKARAGAAGAGDVEGELLAAHPISSLRNLIIARQALAASAPLFLRLRSARASAWASFSTVRMP